MVKSDKLRRHNESAKRDHYVHKLGYVSGRWITMIFNVIISALTLLLIVYNHF